MACVLWKDECETTTEEFMKRSNHENVINMIFKKFEDKYGCKGGGYFGVISIPMKNFNDQSWSLSWKV